MNPKDRRLAIRLSFGYTHGEDRQLHQHFFCLVREDSIWKKSSSWRSG